MNPQLSDCRSCGQAIAWLRTRAGRSIPVDAATVQPGDEVFDPNRHRSHFASCPQASTWRRKRRTAGGPGTA